MSFVESNEGVREWLARSRAYSFGADPGWTWYRDRDGAHETVGISDGGLVRVLPDESGSTAWFADVMTEGRPGAGRWSDDVA